MNADVRSPGGIEGGPTADDFKLVTGTSKDLLEPGDARIKLLKALVKTLIFQQSGDDSFEPLSADGFDPRNLERVRKLLNELAAKGKITTDVVPMWFRDP